MSIKCDKCGEEVWFDYYYQLPRGACTKCEPASKEEEKQLDQEIASQLAMTETLMAAKAQSVVDEEPEKKGRGRKKGWRKADAEA